MLCAGESSTNCKGWRFRKQFQRPFTSTALPGKIGSADTLTIARVLEQVAAAVAFDKAQYASTSTSNRPVPSDPHDDDIISTCAELSCSVPPHSLDEPEGFIFEADDDDDMQAVEYSGHFLPEGPPDDFGCMLSDSD